MLGASWEEAMGKFRKGLRRLVGVGILLAGCAFTSRPEATLTPAIVETEVRLRVGQREGPFLLERIAADHVAGRAFPEYPVAVPEGRPVTVPIGGRVSNGCDVSLTLLRIEGDVAVFRKEVLPHAICPICLAAGTRIETPDGPVPVEALRPGMAVWTADRTGRRVPGVVRAVRRRPVPPGPWMLHLVLEDGRAVTVSPGHPLGDGRVAADLQVGDHWDGSRVRAVERPRYTGGWTYDLLPSGETGFYWANGIRLASTLGP